MYEIGDEVIYQGADKRAYKRRGKVTSIAEVDGKPQLMVELDGGETFTAPIDDWSRAFANSCTSTNSVVRNAMAAHRRTARNGNEWIDDPKKKKAMDAIDKKADALYRQLKNIAREFDALRNEQVEVGFYFADYSDAARQIREIHGMK